MSLFQPCDITMRSVAPLAAMPSASALDCEASCSTPLLSNSISYASKPCTFLTMTLSCSDRLDGTHQIDQAVPLEITLALQVRRRRAKDLLDLHRASDEL